MSRVCVGLGGRSARVGSATALALLLTVSVTGRLGGQQAAGQIRVTHASPEAAIARRAIMISFLQAGRVLYESQQRLGECCGLSSGELPPGTYDVRIEGEGIVTEVRRGLLVISKRQTDVIIDLKAGKGLHTVDYATGGLSREELHARLNAIDSNLADIKKAIAQLSRPAKP